MKGAKEEVPRCGMVSQGVCLVKHLNVKKNTFQGKKLKARESSFFRVNYANCLSCLKKLYILSLIF